MNVNVEPETLTLDELRALRSELQQEDDVVSYVRRVAQARIDLVRAERNLRNRGESHEDLPSELRVVLSSHLTGGAPRPPRPVENLDDHALSDELEAICTEHGFSRLEDLLPSQLDTLEEQLRIYGSCEAQHRLVIEVFNDGLEARLEVLAAFDLGQLVRIVFLRRRDAASEDEE